MNYILGLAVVLSILSFSLYNCKLEGRSYTIVERNARGDTIQIYSNVQRISIGSKNGVLYARLSNNKTIGISEHYTWKQN